MSKGHFTALAAALALGAFAPRLAAQDSSTAGVTRPDTSGYTGAGGVDTSTGPGRVGVGDSGITDTSSLRKSGDSSTYAPASGAVRDSIAPMGGDTSGMGGQPADTATTGATPTPGGATTPGTTSNPGGGTNPSGGTNPGGGTNAPSGTSTDAAGVSKQSP